MSIQPNQVRASVATGDDLDVRWFSIKQRMDELFRVELRVVSRNLSVSFDDVIGQDASVSVGRVGSAAALSGVAIEMKQVRVDDDGLATYSLVIAPRAWLMTQRKNFRIFQYKSELDIVKQLLSEWGVAQDARIGREHKPRKFRVQYDESDFTFACRMLQDAGIAFHFESEAGSTKLVLDDQPETRGLTYPLVAFEDTPQVTSADFVTALGVRQRVKPGAMTIGDLDYRRASTSQPRLSARGGLPTEAMLEQFDYEPGAFLFQGEGGGSTPSADDRGASRTDEQSGSDRTNTRLLARRRGDKVVTFRSSILELAPGTLLSVANHPHRVVAPSAAQLVVGTLLEGDHDAAWQIQVEAVPSSTPYRPERKAPRPRVPGLESATVVGPSGDEIHTDEYGRVRVHFHWDRESNRSESSSCWLPTSQPWAGTGFGGVNLPRIGQEVLVEFLGGDPDRPVVIGRLYTEMNPPPDKLPQFKHISGIMSESTPRLVMGGADGTLAGQQTSTLGGGTAMNTQEMGSEVTGTGPYAARSPNGTDHDWSGSGLKFSDADGQQMIYLQAQRDLNITVNNCWRTIVKADRTCKVGSDDILEVGCRHVTVIHGNQTVEIKGEQYLNVSRRRGEQIEGTLSLDVGKSFDCDADLDINYQARAVLSLEATNKIELKCKSSSITMTPGNITVSSGEVYVQPGDGGFKKSR